MQPSASPSQPQKSAAPQAPKTPSQSQPAHPVVNYTAPTFDSSAGQSSAPERDEYSFITEPVAPPRRPIAGLAPNSLPVRLLFGLVSLLLLFIVFAFAKSVLSGSSNKPALLAVARQQQTLVEIAANAMQQRTADETTLNSANTVNITVSSANQQLNTYFVKNDLKFKPFQLNPKLGRIVSNELTTAVANDDYDQTYQGIMQSSLLTYGNLLKQAYKQTKGSKGRTLLRADYTGQQLLLAQLTAPAG